MPPIRCPACTAEYTISSPQTEAACQYCGTRVAFNGVLCPVCHYLSDPESDTCANCGEAFTAFGRALQMQRDARQPPAWLTQTRGRALALKERSEVHSQARMKTFMEIEARRQETLREAQADRRVQDQRILLVSAALILTLLVLIFILALVPR